MRVLCYDESGFPSNSVQLHDPVDTLDVSGGGLSLPVGVLKLDAPKTYTHLRFTAFGSSWIVRVTGIDNLGNTLSNVRYEVDYLKDYFAKQGARNGSYKVLRTSNSALWNEREFDSQYKTTGVFNTSIVNDLQPLVWTGPNTPGETSYGYVACSMTTMVGTVATYLFKNTGWFKFVKTVLDTAGAYTAIQGAVLFPYSFVDSLETLAVTEIALAGDATVSVEDCSLVTSVSPNETLLISYNPQIGDFRDLYLKTYHLYIPLIGVTQVPINHLNGTPLKIKYTFSLVDGSVSAQFGDDVATRVTGGRLPEVPLISSAEPTRIVNALTSGAGGLIASGVAAVANPVAGLVSAGTTIANTAIGIATAGIGALSVSHVSGYYAVTNNHFILSVVSTEYLNTIAEYAYTTGLLSGKVLSQLQQLPIGRHLINSDFNVIGAPWYVDGVKRAYNDWVYVG